MPDILPVDIKKELDALKDAKPDLKFAEFREQAPAHIAPEHIAIYFNLCLK